MKQINFKLLEGKLKPCGTVGWKDCTAETLRKRDLLLSRNLRYFSFKYIYIYIFVNFKILIIEFHVLYVLNMHIKFHSNQMLFIIRSINLFFYTQF